MKTSARVRLAVTAALLAVAATSAARATNVSGAITKNTTWSLSGSPYVVTGNVTVNANKTLTIAAGVAVKFNSGTSLSVIGKLTAVGTAASPITFTSSALTPAPGNWDSIRFYAGSSASRISFATVQYGGSLLGSELVVYSGTPAFDNLTLRNSSGHGLYSTGSASTPTLTLSTVTANAGSGIYLDASGGVTVTDTAITGNGSWAIGADAGCRVLGLTNVTASGNNGGAGNAVGYRGGAITGSETWRAGLPWVFTSQTSVAVAAGGALTIAAGTTVKVASNNQGFDVTGTLTAVGTAASPILITSAAASPTPGSWGCVTFRAGSSASQLAYATIRYGGDVGRCYSNGDFANNPAAVRVYDGTPTLDHLTLSDSSSNGLYVEGAASTPTVRFSTISNNAKSGIHLALSGGLTLSDTALTGNALWAIDGEARSRILGLTNVTASGNGGGTKDAIGNRGGQVSASETWRAGLPWVLYSTSMTINAGGTLTVTPGAVVKFGSGHGMTVNGTLSAVGTAESPINFTSSVTSPAPGSWLGINFNSGSSASRLTYATVRFAGQSGNGGVTVSGGTPVFDRLQVTSAATTGLHVAGASSTPTATFSTFADNTDCGIKLTAGGGVNLGDSALTGNGAFAIRMEPGTRLLGGTNLTVSGNGLAGAGDVIAYGQGTITGSETWGAGLTWALQGWGVQVGSPGSPGTLTLQPGTRVTVKVGGAIYAYGTLTAIGTAQNPILFTSAAATPVPGDWTGLRFYSGSSASRLSYVIAEYGGGGASSANGVGLVPSAVTIDHLVVRKSARHGLVIDASLAVPTLSFLTLVDNVSDDLYVDGGTVTVVNSSFTGPTAYGVYNQWPFASLTATLCYWGAASGPSGVGPGTGTAVTARVVYEPWLVAPVNEANYFSAVTVVNRTFDPAVATQFSLDFTSTQVGNWALTIKNGAGAVVRTLTGHAATATAAWDGKDGGGATQPNGTYSYELATTADGGAVATAVAGFVIIDSSQQLTVTNVSLTPAWFSPNEDGVQDTALLTATASYGDTAWTVTVKNGAGTVVRTASGSGAAISYAWDGRDASGLLQPDGVYTEVITATVGTLTVITPPSSVNLDRTFPAVAFTAPAAGATLSNVYQTGDPVVIIRGTATDAAFLSWMLEYGVGPSPSSWSQMLAYGDNPFTDQPLAGWQTNAYVNGTYTLRLRAWDRAGNVTAALRTTTIGNFAAEQSGRQFNHGSGQLQTYTSTVPFTLNETLVIRNAAGVVVRTLFAGSREAGVYNDVWDGRDAGGVLLPDGPYFYLITLTAGTSTMVWDLTSVFYTDPPAFADSLVIAPYDPFNNSPMTFTIWPGPSKLWIGVAPTDQNNVTCVPPQICLLQGYHEGGSLTVEWAGVDASGALRPEITWLGVISEVNSFSRNAVIAYGTKPKVSHVQVNPTVLGPAWGTQTVTFDLTTYQNQPVGVTVAFLNQSSLSTLRTVDAGQRPPGNVAVSWDGRADNGMLVAAGRYTVTVTVTDASGQQARGQILTQVQY